MNMSKSVLIITGESSGELYGAMLSRALKRLWPDIEITGIGGNRMKAEGVNLIAQISGALGLTETIRHWGEIRRSFKRAREALRTQRPDVLVLIDYPDFNIALAAKAKAVGIPILYYVSPQVWAWRPKRTKKIARLVNRMAVILPFETDIYKNVGLAHEFVGHPIAETIDINQTKEELKQKLGLNVRNPAISLLPGSRFSEIKRHMPILKGVAEKIHNEFPENQLLIPLAPGSELTEQMPDYIKVLKDSTKEALACSEAAAVASGTATLETALIGTPMVVFYKLSPLTFFFGKLLVKVKFISLVNILAKEEVVVELIQKKATVEGIFSELMRLMYDIQYRQKMISNLQKIKEMMDKKTASLKVASMIGELAGWNTTNGC